MKDIHKASPIGLLGLVFLVFSWIQDHKIFRSFSSNTVRGKDFFREEGPARQLASSLIWLVGWLVWFGIQFSRIRCRFDVFSFKILENLFLSVALREKRDSPQKDQQGWHLLPHFKRISCLKMRLVFGML